MRTFKDQGPVHPEDSAAAGPDDHTVSRRRSGQRRLADIVDDDTRKGTGMSAQRGIALGILDMDAVCRPRHGQNEAAARPRFRTPGAP